MRRILLALIVAFVAVSFMPFNPSVEKRDRSGATIGLRCPDEGKVVYFIFTADSMFEGGNYALDALKVHDIKASFFFTGNFLRDSITNGPVVRRTINEGHYVGPHSDRHILLADWDANRTTLVTPDSCINDIRENLRWLTQYGVDTIENRFMVPPFEWYNKTHIDAYRKINMLPVNPSPGILTYRDYTTPDADDYFSSDTIWTNFMDNVNNRNLDGSFIILHLGTQDIRTDKFYFRLGEMIDTLKSHGYRPIRL